MDVSKIMGLDEIQPKIIKKKYPPSNESFINGICKLLDKCKEYEMILCKTALVIKPQHKKIWYT